MASRGNSAAAGAGSTSASASGSGGGGGGGISKAYSSHLAIQTDAAKYRGKYKELKKKVRQIEMENDKLHYKTLRIKRNIQRMRLERAILYERLEAELGASADLSARATAANPLAADFNQGAPPHHHAPPLPPPHHHHQHHHRSSHGGSDYRQRSDEAAGAPSRSGPSPSYSPSPVNQRSIGAGASQQQGAAAVVPPARSSRTGAVMDYSPSPEGDPAPPSDDVVAPASGRASPLPTNAASAAEGGSRGAAGSMKVTLKRGNNHSNGSNNGSAKEGSW